MKLGGTAEEGFTPVLSENDRSGVLFFQERNRVKTMEKNIPYKIYLEENEMPKQWYNVRADMKKKPAPILNPETLKPVTED